LKEGATNVSGATTAFPILGGRLLKKDCFLSGHAYTNVSNPWREAIEEVKFLEAKQLCLRFQSLEGGY